MVPGTGLTVLVSDITVKITVLANIGLATENPELEIYM